VDVTRSRWVPHGTHRTIFAPATPKGNLFLFPACFPVMDDGNVGK